MRSDDNRSAIWSFPRLWTFSDPQISLTRLNYQPDWIARSMAIGRTYLVGLAHPDLMHSFSFRREVDCSDTEIRETTGVLR